MKQTCKLFKDEDCALRDFGTCSEDSVELSIFAHRQQMRENKEYSFGILLILAAEMGGIAANKHQHIRAVFAQRKMQCLLAHAIMQSFFTTRFVTDCQADGRYIYSYCL
jgi:ribose 5-phosphate isomerase RpiB